MASLQQLTVGGSGQTEHQLCSMMGSHDSQTILDFTGTSAVFMNDQEAAAAIARAHDHHRDLNMQGFVVIDNYYAEACFKKVFIHKSDAGLQCTHLRDRQETAEPAVN